MTTINYLIWIFICIINSFEYQVLSSNEVIARRAVDACAAKMCKVHNSCAVSLLDATECQCLGGYRWKDFQLKNDCIDIEECGNHFHDPCGHRGACLNTIGSYTCGCLSGWQGSHCQQNTTYPQPPCMPGYSGHMCQDGVCGHNGYAEATGHLDDFICICRPGWTHAGPDKICDIDINECLIETTCQHGSTCQNSPGHYKCTCVSPWVGRNCTDFDCSVKPCENSGVCVNKICNCTDRWTGPDCSVKITTSTAPATTQSSTDHTSTHNYKATLDTVVYASAGGGILLLLCLITACGCMYHYKKKLRTVEDTLRANSRKRRPQRQTTLYDCHYETKYGRQDHQQRGKHEYRHRPENNAQNMYYFYKS